MNQKKCVFVTFLLLSLGVLAYTSNKDNNINPGESIKVGVILPLTGDLAALGQETQKGIELGIKEAKEKGIQIDVVYGDDKSNFGIDTASEAYKLANIDKVDVVLTLFVEESKPITPILSKSKTPLLVLWDSNEFITEAGPYVFSNGFSTEKAAIKIANYAFKNLGKRKIAILGHIDPWAEISIKSFKEEFTSLGGEIIYEDTVSITTKDYRSNIAKIKQSDFDSIYFPLIPPTSTQFLTQVKQLGIQTTLLTGDLIPSVVDDAKTSAEGIYTTNIFTSEDSILNTKYKDMYHTEITDSTLVSFGYDGIDAVLKAKEKSSTNLTKGFSILYGEKRSADKEERLYQVQNGKQILIKE